MFIITRETWQAPANRRLVLDSTPRDNEVIIHTEAGSVGRENDTLEQDIAHMRSIDNYHFKVRKWTGGVGYQFVIMQSGRIFEGRGWRFSGGHTVGLNSESGFCFAGHGDKVDATPAQWESMRWLIATSIAKGYLTDKYRLSGHRDHIPPGTKSCPGSIIYPKLKSELSISRVLPYIMSGDNEMADYSEQLNAIHEHIDLAVMALTGSQYNVGDIRQAEIFDLKDLVNTMKLNNLDLVVRTLRKIEEDGIKISTLSDEELATTVVTKAVEVGAR